MLTSASLNPVQPRLTTGAQRLSDSARFSSERGKNQRSRGETIRWQPKRVEPRPWEKLFEKAFEWLTGRKKARVRVKGHPPNR